MTALLLALGAAAAYGVSDFVGGLSSRRTSPWPVAAVASAVGAGCALVAAPLVPSDGGPADLAWGALAGVGTGLGGLLLGERLGALTSAGLLVALPGIWLVAREPGARVDAGLVDGLLAGAGFGVLFAATGQVPASAGLWPLVATQVVGLTSVVVLAATMREPWLSRDCMVLLGGSCAGVLTILALLGLLLATQQGQLAVSAVLASLYPAVTVVLARFLLAERLHRSQVGGLLLCGVTVLCVAMG